MVAIISSLLRALKLLSGSAPFEVEAEGFSRPNNPFAEES